jgi:hypothetical protein
MTTKKNIKKLKNFLKKKESKKDVQFKSNSKGSKQHSK